MCSCSLFLSLSIYFLSYVFALLLMYVILMFSFVLSFLSLSLTKGQKSRIQQHMAQRTKDTENSRPHLLGCFTRWFSLLQPLAQRSRLRKAKHFGGFGKDPPPSRILAQKTTCCEAAHGGQRAVGEGAPRSILIPTIAPGDFPLTSSWQKGRDHDLGNKNRLGGLGSCPEGLNKKSLQNSLKQ